MGDCAVAMICAASPLLLLGKFKFVGEATGTSPGLRVFPGAESTGFAADSGSCGGGGEGCGAFKRREN